MVLKPEKAFDSEIDGNLVDQDTHGGNMSSSEAIGGAFSSNQNMTNTGFNQSMLPGGGLSGPDSAVKAH